MHDLQEQGHSAKRNLDQQETRHEDLVTNFERQVRELRSQLNMKNKDASNLREEVVDLEQRLNSKQTELRSAKSSLQVLQARFEEAQLEIETMQLGAGRGNNSQSRNRADDSAIVTADELTKAKNEVLGLREQNTKLSEQLKELQLMNQSLNKKQGQLSFGQRLEVAAYPHDETHDRNDNAVDDLVAHFENFNMDELGATLHRSMTERN